MVFFSRYLFKRRYNNNRNRLVVLHASRRLFRIAILANVCQVLAVVGRGRGRGGARRFAFRFHYVRVHKRTSFKLAAVCI